MNMEEENVESEGQRERRVNVISGTGKQAVVVGRASEWSETHKNKTHNFRISVTPRLANAKHKWFHKLATADSVVRA